MALGVALGTRTVPGAVFEVPAVVTGDNSYPTGGYAVTPQTFGLNILKRLIVSAFTTLAGGAYEVSVIPTLNPDGSIASANLALTVGTTGVQVASGANVSTVSIQLFAYGE